MTAPDPYTECRRYVHPGPCQRPSHMWFARNFAPFCAACRALAAWLDRPRKARR